MAVDPSPASLSAGTKAPDFDLLVAPGARDTRLSLADLRGRPVVLAFYPYNWSPTCDDQLALYSEIYDEFERFGAVLVGISVDSIWSHRAYIEHRHLRMQLLADFEPKGAVAKVYGVYNASGKSERALFVIDGDGIIRWRYVSAVGVNPGADGILQVLEQIAVEEVIR